MKESLMTKLEPPRFENSRTMLIAGLGERYTPETSVGIPAQWQRFAPHIVHVPGQVGRATYGVLANTDAAGNTSEFSYDPTPGAAPATATPPVKAAKSSPSGPFGNRKLAAFFNGADTGILVEKLEALLARL